MKIIKPSVKILKADNPLKLVELAGRTCYKSENKITEDSYIKFVQSMIDRGHTAMLEHANYTLKENTGGNAYKQNLIDLNEFKYMHFTKNYYSINARTIAQDYGLREFLEGAIQSDSIINPDTLPLEDRLIHKHITLKFICDRGVSHELVRHRTVSFAQESTRYCNYSNDKFGNELTFIEPCFLSDRESELYYLWNTAIGVAEQRYFELLSGGFTPQEARSVLPNSLKTEVVMTTNLEGWKHFLDLRYYGKTGKPHPQMYEVAAMAYEILKQEEPEIFGG